MHLTITAVLAILVQLSFGQTTPESQTSPPLIDLRQSNDTHQNYRVDHVNIGTWGECIGGWHRYKGNCYKWSAKREENWFRAQLNCAAIGGVLASIESIEESSILRGIAMCRNEAWVGLVNTEYENSMFVRREGWGWWNTQNHDFTRMTVTNKVGLDCTFVKKDGSWTNSLCSHKRRSWLCEKAIPATEERRLQASTRPPVICPRGWVFYKRHCYFFSRSKVNYFHAQLYCSNETAHVVTIHNNEEQAFVQAVNGCDNAFWIGLEQANPCVRRRGHARCWEWTDLSRVRYTNWDVAHPRRNSIECAHSKGYWENSIPCTQKHQFVCKKKV